MSSLGRTDKANRYWRSLGQLADTAEFRALAESEFPAVDEGGRLARRRWLQLMGASLALAGLGGCRWQQEEILPFSSRPAGRTPGKPQRFATAMDLAGSADGLLVTCVDGRPVKIEGNPNHPQSSGATIPLAQAAILELYDPERSQNVHHGIGRKDSVESWERFVEFARSHFGGLRQTGGAGFRVLAEASSSPTLAALRARLLAAFPGARWHEYEPISRDNQPAGARLALGRPLRTHFALQKASVIACLDDDLLGSHPAAVAYARDFARGRDPDSGPMNRLYSVESDFSITGAAADHRLPLPSGQIAALVGLLERALAMPPDRVALGAASGGGPRRAVNFVEAMAADLDNHRGRAVVTVGPRQPAEVHAAAHRINAMLGGVGNTLTYTTDPEPDRPSHAEAMRSLVTDVANGEVVTLLILGGNPLYDAPGDLDFGKVLADVQTTIHLSLYRNETSRQCTWHLPRAHFLESWGDARSYDGTYSVVQPLIAPLYGGKSPIELLAMILAVESPNPQTLIRTTFDKLAGGGDLVARLRQTVHDGLLEGSQWAPVPASAGTAVRLPDAGIAAVPENGRLEIVFCRDASVYDGRFANNGWLQEMPDPMTRLTWGNAAVISPATAKMLDVEDGRLVKLKYRGAEVEMPAYVMPGQAAGSVAVSLGYGRTAAGYVGGRTADGIPSVGVDVYKLRTWDAMEFGSGLTVEPTGAVVRLAGTQDHFAIDVAGMRARQKRVGQLVRETTPAQYEEYRKLAPEERKEVDITGHRVHHPPLASLWKEPPFAKADHRWAMAIDLSKCIGCGACVVACQAENNVPVVGRERILQGRQMHWIRVDRYFKGDPEDPQVVLQPVACHHCELAPCEQVCPVAATVHSEEGLNDMVYNRCVGTRYCANNCPFKVRRFNYFNYHKPLKDPRNEVAKMAYNPEVTVRSRGVMEKCTYCVQRIQAAKIEAKSHRRTIADGRIATACQQACPTGAIVFGDLGPPDQSPENWSEVRRAHEAVRSYTMLEGLYLKPRTAYLARIRNLNPQLEETTNHGGTEKHGKS